MVLFVFPIPQRSQNLVRCSAVVTYWLSHYISINRRMTKRRFIWKHFIAMAFFSSVVAIRKILLALPAHLCVRMLLMRKNSFCHSCFYSFKWLIIKTGCPSDSSIFLVCGKNHDDVFVLFSEFHVFPISCILKYSAVLEFFCFTSLFSCGSHSHYFFGFVCDSPYAWIIIIFCKSA